jgi:hypothetical protein
MEKLKFAQFDDGYTKVGCFPSFITKYYVPRFEILQLWIGFTNVRVITESAIKKFLIILNFNLGKKILVKVVF